MTAASRCRCQHALLVLTYSSNRPLANNTLWRGMTSQRRATLSVYNCPALALAVLLRGNDRHIAYHRSTCAGGVAEGSPPAYRAIV
jgi:hypothetical protein